MKLFWFSILFSTFSWGQVSEGDIKNFNFTYRAPLGQGTAESFFYRAKGAQKVNVEKIGQDFKLTLQGVEDRELTLRNLPAIIKDSESMEVSGFNLNLGSSVALSTIKAQFVSHESELSLSAFSLNCNRPVAQGSLVDQLMVGCLDRMSLRATSFNSQNTLFLEEIFMPAFDEKFSPNQAIGIRNLSFKVSTGRFDLSADVRAQVSGKATASGTLKYAASSKQLTIQINEVKFGILDVTSRVFQELKKQESSTLKVERPYVYITIK